MFKKTAIITGIALAMSAGAQADYDWELGAGYTGGTISQEAKNNKITANGTYSIKFACALIARCKTELPLSPNDICSALRTFMTLKLK